MTKSPLREQRNPLLFLAENLSDLNMHEPATTHAGETPARLVSYANSHAECLLEDVMTSLRTAGEMTALCRGAKNHDAEGLERMLLGSATLMTLLADCLEVGLRLQLEASNLEYRDKSSRP